jgi:hypothetical protein
LPAAAVEFTIETPIDFAKREIVEKILVSVAGGPAATIYNTISLAHDVLTQVYLNKGKYKELIYQQRISPSERK